VHSKNPKHLPIRYGKQHWIDPSVAELTDALCCPLWLDNVPQLFEKVTDRCCVFGRAHSDFHH
jgi:hypothetical protein